MMSLPSLPSTPADDPQFVNAEETKKYQCILHMGILRDAMQTWCGHRYCASCIQSYLQSGDQLICPAREEDCVELSSSGENKTHINPDSSARREILNLKVYCTYRKFGCKKTMPWKQLQNHESSCNFKKVPCLNGCGESLAPDALQKHLDSECRKRLIKCKTCSVQIQFDMYQDHVARECPGVLIHCPYKCPAKQFVRAKLPEHLEVCPNKPKPCKFSNAGCKFEGASVEAVQKHEAENVQHHLDLLTVHFSSMVVENRELKAVFQDLKGQRDTLAAKLSVQAEKNREMAAKVEKFQTSNKELQVRIVTLTERIITMERKQEEFAKKDEVQRCTGEVNTIQETLMMQDQRIARIESTGGARTESRQQGGATEASGDTRIKLSRHEQQLGIQDVRLAEMDIRFQILESACYKGTLMWKIREYKRRKQEAVTGKTISLYSQPFYTDRFGYKMCARVYLNGDGMGKGTHMSLFFVVMRGEYDALLRWPFQRKVILTLLDQEGNHHLSDSFHTDITSNSFRRPVTEMNIASGCPMFARHEDVEHPPYLVDDTIFIKLEVNQDPR